MDDKTPERVVDSGPTPAAETIKPTRMEGFVEPVDEAQYLEEARKNLAEHGIRTTGEHIDPNNLQGTGVATPSIPLDNVNPNKEFKTMEAAKEKLQQERIAANIGTQVKEGFFSKIIDKINRTVGGNKSEKGGLPNAA